MRSFLFLLAFGALCLAPTLRSCPVQAQEEGSWRRLHDLRGPWQFQIGDNPDWAAADHPDGGWDAVFVPAKWEDEGFPGYDGFAWYRRHFRLGDVKGRSVYLRLGRVDDVDHVYVNGQFIGSTGTLPPDYRTGYHSFRTYRIPESALRSGDNVIAVRVYDDGLEGGITEGQIGIYERLDHPPMVADLTGPWLFRPGDDPGWKAEKISERGWSTIQVPAFWEPQGFEDYDGMAWYRVRFRIPESAAGEDLVLLLGQIDDLDETYLNGVRVGRTGDLRSKDLHGDEYRRVRVYRLPAEVVRAGAYNTLAVRVYDGLLDGGIYGEGPVGVFTRESYDRWRRDNRSAFDRLIDWFENWE